MFLYSRNIEHDCDGLKENLDEEICSKDNLTRQLNKTQMESDMWRQKYEVEGLAKAEELEMAKLKLQVDTLEYIYYRPTVRCTHPRLISMIGL